MASRRFSSIRTVLLFWYAVILVLAIGGLTGFLYSFQRRALAREIDNRIVTHATAIAAAAENEDEDGFELELDDDYLAAFRGGGAERPYIVIRERTGRTLFASRPGLDVPAASTAGFRDRGTNREVVVSGRHGLVVLVGQDTAEVRQRLSRFLWILAGAGSSVLALALFGGWLLSGRVLAPIRRMSAAAAEISDTNLARRIDVGTTETELWHLARTLNSAFDRLQATVERQSRFTADASHELRTPVSVVLATAEQVLSRERAAPEYREALEAVLRAARRMKNVVDGLLILSRADSGNLSLARAPVQMTGLLRETLDLLAPLAAEQGVTLDLSGPEVTIAGDRDRLRDVFSNLVSNGIRYNRSGGKVAVSVVRTEDGVEVAVRDTGIGIAAEHLPRLFDRFYRVDPARSREVGGSGLGLAITEWIVRSLGGTLAVESREGEGSTFTVRLPDTD